MFRSGRDKASQTGRDPGDFAALYEEFFEPVSRYCRIRTGDDGEDLTAAVFARAFAAYPPANRESTRAWLFAIAHNVVANHYRDRVQRQRIRPLDDAAELVDPAAPPEQITILSEERRSLHAALASLTDDQRQVVELRLAGLTGPEIANVLGRSHAAVKMLQLRAIERLRQILVHPTNNQLFTEEEGHARR